MRFAQLVEKSGKPRLHVMWGPPEKDREFQQAVKANRVLTIHQENVGTKKDFGKIGFSKEGPAQFLIFPRSLNLFEDRRVVGINYELFESELKPRGKAQKSDSVPGFDQDSGSKTERKKLAVHNLGPARQENRSEKTESKFAASVPSDQGKSAKASERTIPESHSVKAKPRPPSADLDRRHLLKELRSVLSGLRAGKTVAAFQRLEKLTQSLAEEKAQ